ncbi:MAG: helix-turn-helix transcriptional regulator [Berryella intestinalis]|uniref:helix-turn-helix domain-containing protein n=1 Tax=Berryella intestinalis TaxID=1531429 RepID=UPI002A54267F|nr:helix-turn-helix transcriptional regulator [Berryella intestinalis]MDD7369116.1 helix-turn-helix transcriptional regulator [Berryella intestinalis]MDY3129780.1 helix-turn-helix transcriptional regulator [Berryella intestinalis]
MNQDDLIHMGGDCMRYFEIGQRIRRYRKACGLSQETLAGKVGISVTHMSHIETGNTKLSLPVLAKIAEELSVGTDALLFDEPKLDKSMLSAKAWEILDSFEADELPVAIEVLRALRDAMAKRHG